MYDSGVLLHRAVSTLHFLPASHLKAFETYVRVMTPTQSNPQVTLHTSLLGVQSTVQGLLSALSRPTALIGEINAAKREAERNHHSATRPSRWPLGLLDDTRQRSQDEKEEKARKSREEAGYLSRELRYTQQTVAGELAGWQNLHDRMTKRVIREYARGMVIQERAKLDGMMRALRSVRASGPADTKWATRSTSLKVQDREMAEAGEASGGGGGGSGGESS